MKRKFFGNKMVRKSIVWAMSLVMACSPLGGSMTVFAEGTEESSAGATALVEIASEGIISEAISPEEDTGKVATGKEDTGKVDTGKVATGKEDTGKGDTGKENAGEEYTDPQGHMVEETTVSTEQYKVDGADADQEQAEGLTLDHTMVETTAEADTYYMIVNSDGNYLEDEEGNAIKVSSDAELKEVKAYDATQAEAPDGDAVKAGADAVLCRSKRGRYPVR